MTRQVRLNYRRLLPFFRATYRQDQAAARVAEAAEHNDAAEQQQAAAEQHAALEEMAAAARDLGDDDRNDALAGFVRMVLDAG